MIDPINQPPHYTAQMRDFLFTSLVLGVALFAPPVARWFWNTQLCPAGAAH